jgi:hypothetical protein
VVRGASIASAGKRADALMKTRGTISSLCFVEIKRHDTPLLAPKPPRPEVWAPSAELTGGVAQMQTTVHAAIETLGHKFAPMDDEGNPTGEELFSFEPRSCLMIGSFAEFVTDRGTNKTKFRAFELYRRNTWRPEIITFDELLERARLIIDNSVAESATRNANDLDDIPF